MIKHEISKVTKNSIADKMGTCIGDFLCSINGEEVRDVLDYRFRIHEESLLVEIEKPNGEVWELDIEKEADDDLGLEFKQSLMSRTKRCRNKCVFCFVDQQPPGLRPSLYVKDDDARLSFLIGNYVTLTNLTQDEIQRLAGYHLSPLRISVHAADLDLREKMMGTPAARNLFDALDVFNRAGIEMHFQIVLCKGLNDGAFLDDTIEKLMAITPGAKSLAIVPAGLTRHRDGLFPLEPFTREDARGIVEKYSKSACRNLQNVTKVQIGEVVDVQTEPCKNGIENAHGNIYLSDEWYILAGLPLPKYSDYGVFPQLDNGVGVLRLFEREFLRAMFRKNKIQSVGFPYRLKCVFRRILNTRVRVGIVTGTAAGNFMRGIAKRFMAGNRFARISVFEIENEFLGDTVTVSGLLAGQDVIAQLKGMPLPDVLFLPENAFRAGVKQKVMLDGTTLGELRRALGVKVVVGSTDGGRFFRQLMEIF